MSMQRERAEREGRRAEGEAAAFLEKGGWHILAMRRKTPVGEVDIVARNDATVVFVEVKWRRKPADLDFAIDEARLARVASAAEVLAPEYARPGDDLRIDVILLAPGAAPRHIANAWQP